MKKIFFTLIASLFIIITSDLPLQAQNWKIVVGHPYKGWGNDYAYNIKIIDNSPYIVGSSSSKNLGTTPNGGRDAWLLKTDYLGNILSTQGFGGSGFEYFNNVFPAPDSGLYLLGSTISSDDIFSFNPYLGGISAFALKLDSSNNIVWNHIYGGNRTDELKDVVMTYDGGFVFVVWSTSNDGDVGQNFGAVDVWVVKLTDEGQILWSKVFGNHFIDIVSTIIETSDKGLLIGGSFDYYKPGLGNLFCDTCYGNAEAFLIKLDSVGNVCWTKCYGGPGYDGFSSLLEVSDGYVLGGYASAGGGLVTGFHNNAMGYNDAWVIKTDFEGNIIWTKCLGGSGTEIVYKMFKEKDGNLMIFSMTDSHDGDVNSNFSDYYYMWLVLLNGQDGSIIKEKCINVVGTYWGAAAQIEYGDYILLINVPTLYNWVDVWFYRIKDCNEEQIPPAPAEPKGPQQINTYTTTTSFYSLTPDGIALSYTWELNPPEAGWLMTPADTTIEVVWNPNFWGTARLKIRGTYLCGIGPWSSELKISVNVVGMEEPDKEGFCVWPNPSNDRFIFELPASASYTIQITDISGRQIEKIETAGGTTQWDASACEPGIYLYRITSEGFLKTGKLVKQK